MGVYRALLRLEHSTTCPTLADRNLELCEALRAAPGITQAISRLWQSTIGGTASKPDHENGLGRRRTRWRRLRFARAQTIAMVVETSDVETLNIETSDVETLNIETLNIDDVARVSHKHSFGIGQWGT